MQFRPQLTIAFRYPSLKIDDFHFQHRAFRTSVNTYQIKEYALLSYLSAKSELSREATDTGWMNVSRGDAGGWQGGKQTEARQQRWTTSLKDKQVQRMSREYRTTDNTPPFFFKLL